MPKLTWDTSGSRLYEAGVDRGVVYSSDKLAYVWNGLISINETPSDSDVRVNYYDGHNFTSGHSPGSFAATIQAFTYPDLIDEGSPFNLSYRTMIGNDVEGLDHGYRIHLVYNAKVTPTVNQNSSISDQASGETFSWNLTTIPVAVDRSRASAHLYIDTTYAYPGVVTAIENILYGSNSEGASFPNPEEVVALFDANSVLKITNHGDGTWTAEGPDNVVSMLDSTTFQINWPSVVFITTDEYEVSTL